MKNDKMPLLSICIPTYKRVDVLKNTIESIFRDTDGVSLSDFEVIISDNDPEQECRKMIESFEFTNLHYYYTSCEGFLNSFYSLSYGKGEYLKLHNNQITFRPGTLRLVIEHVKTNRKNHTMFVFTNGNLLNNKVTYCNGFDSFMNTLSYFCSWSSGYGMWKEDYDKVKNVISVDKYFPQTSLLLSQYYNENFIVDDRPIFGGQKVQKKGGYNTYEVFGCRLLDMINLSCKMHHISDRTFQNIRTNLLYDYLAVCYFKTVIIKYDNFEHSCIRKHLSKYYTGREFIFMVMISYLTPLRQIIKKISRSLVSCQY